MSQDTLTFRNHCRQMATATHRPDCPSLTRINGKKPAKCDGCVTDSDRALWAQLANEMDAYGVAG